MRGLLILVAVVLLLLLAGWISFNDTGERATIGIEKEEIREDTQEFVQEGREMLDRAGNAVGPTDADEVAPADPDSSRTRAAVRVTDPTELERAEQLSEEAGGESAPTATAPQ